MDSLQQDQIDEFLVAVCTSAPAKVLFLGTDALLTTSFRGGLAGEEEVSELELSHKALWNDEIGLKMSSEASPGDFEATSLIVKGEEQKAYGALVPVRLWEQAFLRGYGHEGSSHLLRHQLALGIHSDKRAGIIKGPKPPDGWATALEGFRMLGLIWWRRHVLRGFYAWRKANVGGVSSVGLVKHSTGIRQGKGVRTFVWAAHG